MKTPTRFGFNFHIYVVCQFYVRVWDDPSRKAGNWQVACVDTLALVIIVTIENEIALWGGGVFIDKLYNISHV